jgi:Ca2+-transporting ATPase
VVLLELIIDPTCSIVLERQPAEEDIMDRPPRDPKEQMLTRGGLFKSVLQGLTIFVAAFGTYFWTLAGNPGNAPAARAMGMGVLMLSNIMLVQENCSERDFAVHSIRRLARDKVMWLVNLGTLAGLAAILYTPLANVLKLAPLSGTQLLIVLGMALASTMWYELVKVARKMRRRA